VEEAFRREIEVWPALADSPALDSKRMGSPIIEKVMRRVLALPHQIPGYVATTRRLRSRSIAVLAYHGLVREPLPVFNWCQLPVHEFEKQIDFISREYVVLPLCEIVERLARGAPLPRATACLTFDDGFRSVRALAAPVLDRYQLPASCFLVTSLIGTDQPAWPDQVFEMFAATSQNSVTFQGTHLSLETSPDRANAYSAVIERLKTMEVQDKDDRLAELRDKLGWRPVSRDSPLATLDWREIAEMAHSGLFEFGSHTHTHQILSRCSIERQAEELSVSRDLLREHLRKSDLFAYPNGRRQDFSDDTKRLLRQTGYRCALCTIPGLQPASGDLYEIRRVNIGADTTLEHFEMRLAGL
jgi:peptidoglycan/xylan/chitin deacetylase (PgdA/CDA1 family)